MNYIEISGSYGAVNKECLSYKNQSVNAIQENNRCLIWDPRRTRKYIVWKETKIFERQPWGYIIKGLNFRGLN